MYRSDARSYVWLHPKDHSEMKITPSDELFVLSDKIPHSNLGVKTAQENNAPHAQNGKFMVKNEEKKIERENLQTLESLNKHLLDIYSTTKEVFQDVKNTN